MSIEKTIDQYRDTKNAIESIIDRHMAAAFDEIRKEFGDTPTGVSLNIDTHQTMSEKYPHGIYAGCRVDLGGE